MTPKTFPHPTLLLVAGLLLTLALAACAPPALPPAAPEEPALPTENESLPLEGTLWIMQSYADADGQTLSPLAETRATAEFTEGRVSGNGSCNQYSGSYTLDDSNLEIMLGPMTMMACPEPIMQQEMQFMAALGDVRTYEISGSQLTMMDESGAVVLTFAADVPLPLVGTNWRVSAYNNGKGGLVSSLNTELMTALYAADGALTGFSGCNNYMGSYTLDGNTIAIGPLATTRMACLEPESLMEDEAGYLAALERVRTYVIRGEELTMFDSEGTRTVVYRAAASIDEAVAGAAVPGSEEPTIDSVMVEQRNGEWVAIVQGQNADACPRMYLPSQEVSANDIAITLSTVRPQDAICAQALTPFTEEVAIDTSGLEAGEYAVSVNGVAADQPITVELSAAAKASVTGVVTYRQRSALPPDAVVTVQIQDISLADAPAKVIGEQIIDNPGQVPIAYDVAYDPAEVIENHMYSMSARITDASDKLLFISDTITPVLTRGAPASDVEITVVPVGN